MGKDKIEWQKIVAYIIFAFFTVYWIIFWIYFGKSDANHHQIYTFSTLYGVMAIWGAISGIIIAQKWGGIKSTLGKALLFFSLGLLFQEFGQLFYSYTYIVLHLATANYPSLGDVGFFGTIPLYCLGIIYLAKASGITIRIKSLTHVLPAIAITFGILGLGYFMFLQGYKFDWSNPIKVFLDFGYPLGEAIYISLAIATYILTRGVLGGIMKSKILFILFALCIQFLADYTFLYQTSKGTWVDSGMNDFTYFVAYFVMTIGLIQFNSIYNKLKGVS